MTTAVTPDDALDALRAEWKRLKAECEMWTAIRSDKKVDYRAFSVTDEERDRAGGDVVVAVWTVRDERIQALTREAALVEREAAAIKVVQMTWATT